MRKHEEVTVFLVILIIFVIEVITGPICHRAEYLIGEECCPMCPVGTRVNKHCTEFRSTSCLPCDGGTYMDEPTGRTECLRCRMCAAGSGLRVKVSCLSTSDSVCEPEDGFFCVGSSDEGNCEATQKHSLCSPGEFIQKPGSSSTDTVCSPCPPDSFSNGTLSSCRPHTRCEEKNKITVKEGTSQSDAECGERDSTVAVGVGVGVGVGVLLMSLVAVGLKQVFAKKSPNTPPAPRDELNPLEDRTRENHLHHEA